MAFAVVLFSEAWQAASVQAETRIIPSAYTSGRYDSNIFVAPVSFLPPGQQKEDLVGTVGGGMTLEHLSREVDANLTVRGDFNAYVFNGPLNYATTQVQGSAELDRWAERFGKGTKLRFNQSFLYTPEAPGFATGAKGGPSDDTFLRGIQTLRANTFSNTTGVNARYPLMGRLGLEASYRFGIRRLGSLLASNLATGGQANLFNTIQHTWSAGPQFQLTPDDSIAILYEQRLISQERLSAGSGGQVINTNAQSVSAHYVKVMQGWRLELEGGGALIEPASRMFPTGRVRITSNPERATVISIQGSRQVSPSFFLFAGALISNVGRIEVSHSVTDRLRVLGAASYAYNTSVPEGVATFQNFSGSAALQYALTRSMRGDLYYTYTNLDFDAGSGGYALSRNVVGISLTMEWRGGD